MASPSLSSIRTSALPLVVRDDDRPAVDTNLADYAKAVVHYETQIEALSEELQHLKEEAKVAVMKQKAGLEVCVELIREIMQEAKATVDGNAPKSSGTSTAATNVGSANARGEAQGTNIEQQPQPQMHTKSATPNESTSATDASSGPFSELHFLRLTNRMAGWRRTKFTRGKVLRARYELMFIKLRNENLRLRVLLRKTEIDNEQLKDRVGEKSVQVQGCDVDPIMLHNPAEEMQNDQPGSRQHERFQQKSIKDYFSVMPSTEQSTNNATDTATENANNYQGGIPGQRLYQLQYVNIRDPVQFANVMGTNGGPTALIFHGYEAEDDFEYSIKSAGGSSSSLSTGSGYNSNRVAAENVWKPTTDAARGVLELQAGLDEVAPKEKPKAETEHEDGNHRRCKEGEEHLQHLIDDLGDFASMARNLGYQNAKLMRLGQLGYPLTFPRSKPSDDSDYKEEQHLHANVRDGPILRPVRQDTEDVERDEMHRRASPAVKNEEVASSSPVPSEVVSLSGCENAKFRRLRALGFPIKSPWDISSDDSDQVELQRSPANVHDGPILEPLTQDTEDVERNEMDSRASPAVKNEDVGSSSPVPSDDLLTLSSPASLPQSDHKSTLDVMTEVDYDEIDLETMLAEVEAKPYTSIVDDNQYGIGFDPDPNAPLSVQAERYNELHADEFETPFATPEFLARGDKVRNKAMLEASGVISDDMEEPSPLSLDGDIKLTPASTLDSGMMADEESNAATPIKATKEDTPPSDEQDYSSLTLDQLMANKNSMPQATTPLIYNGPPLTILKTGLDITNAVQGGKYEFSHLRIHELPISDDSDVFGPVSFSSTPRGWRAPRPWRGYNDRYTSSSGSGSFFRGRAEMDSEVDNGPYQVPLYFKYGIQHLPPSVAADIQNEIPVWRRSTEGCRTLLLTGLPNDITLQILLAPPSTTSLSGEADAFKFSSPETILPASALKGSTIIRAVITNTTPITGWKSAMVVFKSEDAAKECLDELNKKEFHILTNGPYPAKGPIQARLLNMPTYPCRGFLAANGEDEKTSSSASIRNLSSSNEGPASNDNTQAARAPGPIIGQKPTRHLVIPNFPRSISRIQILCDLTGVAGHAIGFEFFDEAALLRCYKGAGIVRVWVEDGMSSSGSAIVVSGAGMVANDEHDAAEGDDAVQSPAVANTTSTLHIEFSSITAAMQGLAMLRRRRTYSFLRIEYAGNDTDSSSVAEPVANVEAGVQESEVVDAMQVAQESRVKTQGHVHSMSAARQVQNDDEIDLIDDDDSDSSTVGGGHELRDIPHRCTSRRPIAIATLTPIQTSTLTSTAATSKTSWADEVIEAAEMEAEAQNRNHDAGAVALDNQTRGAGRDHAYGRGLRSSRFA